MSTGVEGVWAQVGCCALLGGMSQGACRRARLGTSSSIGLTGRGFRIEGAGAVDSRLELDLVWTRGRGKGAWGLARGCSLCSGVRTEGFPNIGVPRNRVV